MEIYVLRKEFKTHHEATKWINKQLRDLSYKVHYVDIVRLPTHCIAVVEYYPQ